MQHALPVEYHGIPALNCIRVQFDSALCAAASPCNSKGILLAWGTHSTTSVGFHLWGIYFPTRNGSVWVIDSWLRGAIAPLLEWSASQRGCCFLCPPTLSRLLFGHSCHMFTVTCVTYSSSHGPPALNGTCTQAIRQHRPCWSMTLWEYVPKRSGSAEPPTDLNVVP